MENRNCNTIFKGCCNNEDTMSHENENFQRETMSHVNRGAGSAENVHSQQSRVVNYSNYNGTVENQNYSEAIINSGYENNQNAEEYNEHYNNEHYNNEHNEQYADGGVDSYVERQMQAGDHPNAQRVQSYTQSPGGQYEQNYYNSNYIQQFDENYAQPQGETEMQNYINMYKEQYGNKVPTINIKGDQPVFSVPVYQDKYVRDRIVEVPNYEIQDVIQPKVYTQETRHDVPTIELIYKEKKIELPKHKIVEKPIEVDVPIGYAPIYAPKWDVREVPRPVPKYEGEQKIIEVDVPQIKYIDKYVEKEIVVDVKEKIIPKVTEIEKSVDVIKYEWKEEYQDVPVYKYVPKIDVELDCPPPLIVPYPDAHFQNTTHVVNPNQSASDIPPEVLLKNLNMPKFSNAHVNESMKKTLLEIARSTSPPSKEKKDTKSWFFWKNKKNKNEKSGANNSMNEIDPETGYPKGMPKDFAHFFRQDLSTVEKQMGGKGDRNGTGERGNSNNKNIDHFNKSPVNPTVEYLGKIDKPPVEGGKLDGISFKLHAIEVHQFIPVPSLPKPRFLDLVPPEKIENNDISGLENVFGSVPEGWVDPNVTGFIAPMMHDVLQGNMQTKTLLNKLSIGNAAQKKSSFAVLSPEQQNSFQQELTQEILNCNNNMSYNFQSSEFQSFQRNDKSFEVPN